VTDKKSVQNFLRQIFMYMGQEPNSMNVQFNKYFPEYYNKELFDAYDGVWWVQMDSVRNTILKKIVDKFF
jgi:hypothetical protein